MAIKKVTEIPRPNTKNKLEKPAGYWRPRIHKDIKKAYTEGVDKFEFTRYNRSEIKAEYLAQLAKEEAYEICEELVYKPARAYVKKTLAKELGSDNVPRIITPHRFSSNPIMKIRGVTLPDGVKHIYCEINFQYAKDYKKMLLTNTRGSNKERSAGFRARPSQIFPV